MMSIVQDVDRKRYSNREAWGRGYVRLATLVKQGVTDRKLKLSSLNYVRHVQRKQRMTACRMENALANGAKAGTSEGA